MLLLSIHPRFARMILSGEKTVELRRRAPRRPPEFWVALYATAPECAVIGIVRACEVLVGRPDDLWSRVGCESGLGREEYRSYFGDTGRAVGIRLVDPVPFERPVRLDTLRTNWPGFNPPQSFSYLTEERRDDLLAHSSGKSPHEFPSVPPDYKVCNGLHF